MIPSEKRPTPTTPIKNYSYMSWHAKEIGDWVDRKRDQLINRRAIREAKEGMRHSMNIAVTFWEDVFRYGPRILAQDMDAIPERYPGYRNILTACFSDLEMSSHIAEIPEKSLTTFSNVLRRELNKINKTIFHYTRNGRATFAVTTNQGVGHHPALEKALVASNIGYSPYRIPLHLQTYLSPNTLDIYPFYQTQRQQHLRIAL